MTAPLRLNLVSLNSLRDGSLDASEAARLTEELRRKPGQRSWATIAALRTRDKLIREFACRFLHGENRSKQAEIIHRELSRYSISAWLYERHHAKCRHPNGQRQLLWQIFRARDRVPGERTIYEILGSKL